MTRIQTLFSQSKAFVGYLTAGDGGIERTLEASMALIEGGVNMLEIGMPFSDPIADGPIIQRAAERSLAGGTTLEDVLWLTQQIRKRSPIPLILFSYLNPILSALKTNFLADAKQAGLDGVLLVDCPLEESWDLRQQCIDQGLSLIYVITPSTSLERLQKIHQHAEGLLYYACRKGTTGIKESLPEDFQTNIQAIKSVTDLPVVVGFGISNQAMGDCVLKHAEGMVVGSLFVKALEEGAHPSTLATLARTICPKELI